MTELPPDTPRWGIWLANLIVLAVIGVFIALHYAVGWQFTAGGLFGAFCVHLTYRLKTGRWMDPY